MNQQHIRNYNTQTATNRSLLEYWLEYHRLPVLGQDIVYTQALKAQGIEAYIEPIKDTIDLASIIKEKKFKMVAVPMYFISKEIQGGSIPLPAFNSKHLHLLDNWCDFIITVLQEYDTEERDWRNAMEYLIELNVRTILPTPVKGLAATVREIQQYFLANIPNEWWRTPKQEDYSLIEDYYNVLSAVITLQGSRREIEAKDIECMIQQDFISGCSLHTGDRIPIHVQSLKQLERVIKLLITLEATALEKLQNQLAIPERKQRHLSHSHPFNSSGKYRNSQKYCSYHKSKTHNTNNCNAIKLQK
ncbi:hypothetical protein NEOKW01_0790 [Nematocida sp. AWRm80]|nr:hypothetical protein NEOKW01_0790 [Nematocida sp. AWRm80]